MVANNDNFSRENNMDLKTAVSNMLATLDSCNKDTLYLKEK